MRKHARAVLAAGAALMLSLTACATQSVPGGGNTDDYPDRSIRYVIPFDPGGESDLTARLQQSALEREFGESVVVSNRPGGGGAVAWSQLANQSRPDGYTIMGANLPHIILQPLARGEAGYETGDIKWAYIFESTPNALLVPSDSPYRTIDEFVRAARERTLTVGGSSSFSANHVGTLALNNRADIDLTYVPFSGTAAASPALLGGQVDALMSYNTVARDLRHKGVRMLAVAAEERLPGFPDVPTFRERGYDIVEGAWRGVAVPKETPDAVVDRIAKVFAEVNRDPTVVRKMNTLGLRVENMGPEQSREFIRKRASTARDLLERFDLIEK